MTLDLAETPELTLLRVNGILRFKDDMDVHLKAKHIYVRAGELQIGQKDKPYEKQGRITLYGEKDAKAIVYDNAIEAGNKLIANIGKIGIYGKQRPQKMTRLMRPAFRGDTEITVDMGMDLV
jgi:hypothetical protein